MATFGVIGLGVMGQNLALNVEEHGFPVAVWNYETDWTDKFIANHKGKQFTGCKTLEDLAKNLERPRRILVMIKAGSPVDQTLEKLKGVLEPGDIVIDGGNSWFKDTQRRASCRVATRKRTCRSSRSSRRSRPRPTRARASPTVAPTVPGTSSRWCTTASSTATCS
jgi:6-phosphogluconate dehydrogenase